MTAQVVTAVSIALPLAANLKLFRASLGPIELAANVRPVYIGLTYICYMRGGSCIGIPPFHLDRAYLASIWTYAYEPRYHLWNVEVDGCICICNAYTCTHPSRSCS